LNEAKALNKKVAELYRAGKFGEALPLAQRSVELEEKALGPEHPTTAVSLSNLAVLFAFQQRYPSAGDLFKKALLIQERHIRDVFSFTTESQKLQFIRSISGTYHLLLSLIHQYLSREPRAVRDGLELVLRRKGVVFDAQARTQAAGQGRLPEPARKDWERLSTLRSELARLLLNKPEKMSLELYRKRVASFQQQIEETERRLVGESALVAAELKQRIVTVEAAAKALPQNAALAEFVKFRDFDFANIKGTGTERYLAFILTPDQHVALVDLGEAAALEQQIGQVLEDLRVAQKRQDRPSTARSVTSLTKLSTLIWTPLTGTLGNVDHVLVSPDGLLNLVPFAALPTGDGRYLLEQYRVAYVTSGRELVGVKDRAFHPTTDLLLVANPAYDNKMVAASGADTAVRSRDFRGHFSPLPGTEREAKEIPPLVPAEETKKQVAVGPAATEAVVKTTRSPRILHLATHGFFLEDKPLPIESPISRLASTLSIPAPVRNYENPLVRSGLAFAGANHAGQITEGDDGILTALEITGMDLYGTDLVVLSACETAVGTVQSGEGVFGLRRAFALAGAKNLLMSLWPVDDELTADQMKAFYRNLQNLPPADAFRQAQLETIATLKARDGQANPGLWAPFILQGAQAFGR
jgi:CHAT domain-containing protein